MNVVVVGTGYVGLPTGVCLAELGHQVVCLDREKSKIDTLNRGILTLFEDGLEELFAKNRLAGRLSFTSSWKTAGRADVVIIAVGTPPHPVTKEADLKYVHAAAVEIARTLKGYTVVIVKSTVPVGTAESVDYLIRKTNPEAGFDLVSMPEFLREGFAVHDFFHPDRLVAGVESDRPREVVRNLYRGLPGQMLFVGRRSAELIKYASNSFLAMKIHYINEIADFCAKTGADVEEVAEGMGLDTRIGPKFLKPGPGYGGSCFPKDTLAMAFMGRQNNVELSLVEAAIQGNARRKERVAAAIRQQVEDVPGPKIGVLGLAFKNGTDDCRESPAMEIVGMLLRHNLTLRVFDPLAMENARQLLGDSVEYAQNMHDAARDADLLVVLTECGEFAGFDFDLAAGLMRRRRLVDCRNMLSREKAAACGFDCLAVGHNLEIHNLDCCRAENRRTQSCL